MQTSLGREVDAHKWGAKPALYLNSWISQINLDFLIDVEES